jgi:3-oxoacyl-[acyl-carrier protein] reductase
VDVNALVRVAPGRRYRRPGGWLLADGVNCINPGPNDTGYADHAAQAAVTACSPSGRWGTPADTAKLVAWLLSDEADWVTGQTIASDGGWSAL